MPLLKQSISSYKPVIERNIAHEWKVVIGAKIQPKFQLVYMLHIFKKKNFSPTLHICFQNLTRRNSFCFCHSCRSRGQNFCSGRFPVLFFLFCILLFLLLFATVVAPENNIFALLGFLSCFLSSKKQQ